MPHLCGETRKGAVSRREFLRTAALLGVSLPSAMAFLASLEPSDASSFVSQAAAQEAPQAMSQETPRSGGLLRCANAVENIADPRSVDSIEASAMFRNSLEYLVRLDADNVAQPWLAESWEPNEDLTAWHFRLRPGVTWSNGDAFTAEDVEANFRRWYSPVGRSGMMASLGGFVSFERRGPLEFTLHLAAPWLAVPEALSQSGAAILHRRFDEEGGNWPRNPIGTGPFALSDYQAGQYCRFKRRDAYWGKPAYLDGVDYINVGSDAKARLAALAAGRVDALHRIGPSEIAALDRMRGVRLLRAQAANTLCIRMKPSEKPFDDLRVRRAVVLAADNREMLDTAVRGNGVLAENHHVAPFHPEYAKLPTRQRDVAKAKELLAQAEYTDGVDIELTLGNTQGPWEEETARVLQKNLAEAGIRLKLSILRPAQFWPIFMKVPFGMTYWAHRPLGVTVLDLAYRSGAAWNETGFADAAFDNALDQAMAIIDPSKRAIPIETCERILQDACLMVQPFWQDEMTVVADGVRNFHAHTTDYYRMNEVWKAEGK